MDNHMEDAKRLANEKLKRSHPFRYSSHRGSTMTNIMDFDRSFNGRQIGPSGANYFRNSSIKKVFSFREFKEDHEKILQAMKKQIKDNELK